MAGAGPAGKPPVELETPARERVDVAPASRDVEQGQEADALGERRIDEKVVKDEVQKAGFQLAGQGDFLRNPADPRDWNASPNAATQAGKRGTSDRFALRFVKPAK